MRGLADAERLRRFLRELAREADADAAVYLTGGATAVLLGWRESTIDADILIVPEQDSLYRALPRLKEELQLNVEIASPAHFIPELPGWQERSLLVERLGRLSYYHYDPYSQALAKIERGPGRGSPLVQETTRRRPEAEKPAPRVGRRGVRRGFHGPHRYESWLSRENPLDSTRSRGALLPPPFVMITRTPARAAVLPNVAVRLSLLVLLLGILPGGFVI